MFKRFCLTFVILASCTYPVQAQYNESAQNANRLQQIEKQIQTLSRAVFRGETVDQSQFQAPVNNNGASTEATASLDLRISQIEQQLQEITRRLEEQQHQIDQFTRQTNVQPSLAQTRLHPDLVTSPRPNMNNGVTTTTITSGTVVADPRFVDTTSYDTLSATELYEKSFVEIRDGNYGAAEAGFKTFLEKYPEDNLAANAHYWLAETYYVRANYTEAAKLFAKGYQKYPKSSKTPDNLLKLGLSLAKINKTDDACLTLQQLKTQFPSETGPVIRRADEELNRLNCG